MDKHQIYDAIIVGSGAAGGIAAHVLVNKGLNDATITTDQRNAPRPVGPKSDIGSVELQ